MSNINKAAGVHADLPWSVGDVAHDPWAEDMPDGTVLIDKDGEAWKLAEGDWAVAYDTPLTRPVPEYGPYTIAWLPEEAEK